MSSKQGHVLVFGATGAIGSALCRLLASMPVNITATCMTQKDRAKQLQQELNLAQVLECDVRDPVQVDDVIRQAIETTGPLHAVVNCAGLSATTPEYDEALSADTYTTVQADRVNELFDVNTLGSLNVSQAAGRCLVKTGGNIVLTGSLDCVKAVPSPVHYAMSKMAVRGLVESLARQLGRYQVCVNLVAPGLSTQGGALQLNDEARDLYLKYCGLHRLAEPAEIASMMAWLALENTYLTGQCILLDGGL